MAIKVPNAGAVTTLWQQRAAASTNEYKAGVQGAGQDWQNGVDSGEDNWVSGVNQAAGSHSYKMGVTGKSAKYVDKALSVGAARYPGGVQAGSGAYNVGMGKVLTVIGGTNLPARGPTGSNAGRSSAVADALHQAKLSGQI